MSPQTASSVFCLTAPVSEMIFMSRLSCLSLTNPDLKTKWFSRTWLSAKSSMMSAEADIIHGSSKPERLPKGSSVTCLCPQLPQRFQSR